MRCNFLGANAVCIKAAHLIPKQVLFMVFSSHISMLNGMARHDMFGHDFLWQYEGNFDKFLMNNWANAED